MFAVHMSSTIWHSGDGEGKWSESTSEGFMLADEWGSYTLVEKVEDATHFEKLEDAQAFKEKWALEAASHDTGYEETITIDGEQVGTGHWHNVWEDAGFKIVEC
jgi:hypothetical protein